MNKTYSKLGTIIKELLFYKGMRAADLAREINIPPPTLHRLITGKSNRPYKSSLEPIAKYFAISVEQLLGDQPLKNEKIQDLPDDIHSTLDTSKLCHVPLLSWEQINPFISSNFKANKTILYSGMVSSKAFATTLMDSSMEPIFSPGSLLIFDPDKIPKNRSYVLVRIENCEIPIFRQLLKDAEHQYLKSLNDDLKGFQIRLIGEKDIILGTLLESRISFDEENIER